MDTIGDRVSDIKAGDLKAVASAFFCNPEWVTEVRCLGVDGVEGRVVAGWFKAGELHEAARWVNALGPKTKGVYFTPNVVHPALYERCPGRIVQTSTNKQTGKPVPRLTANDDVPSRCWLIVDVDPERPAKINATEAEREAALAVTNDVRGWLAERGWPEPGVIDSGNGYHLYYRLPGKVRGYAIVNSKDDALARTLEVMNAKLGKPGRVTIDAAVATSARIMRLPGTWNRKGPHSDERPHRPCVMLQSPGTPVADQLVFSDGFVCEHRVIRRFGGDPLPNPYIPSEEAAARYGTSAERELERVVAELDPDGSIRKKLYPPEKEKPAATAKAPRPDDDARRLKRAKAYLAVSPPAIQGQRGSDHAYAAACALWNGFALSEAQSLALLLTDYNPRCVPEWSVSELEHKVRDAATKRHDEARGYIYDRDSNPAADAPAGFFADVNGTPAGGPTIGVVDERGEVKDADPLKWNEADDDPDRIARGFLAGYRHGSALTLRYWQGTPYQWSLPEGRWKEIERHDFRSRTHDSCNAHFVAIQELHDERAKVDPSHEKPKKGKTTPHLKNAVIEAVEAKTIVRGVEEVPAWLSGGDGMEPRECAAVANGVVHLPSLAAGRSDAIRPPTPAFFNLTAADYPVRLDAPPPALWLKFLSEVWPAGEPDSEAAIKLLQEWFGYLLTADTRMQKMLFLHGRGRNGKGTIQTVLGRLVGQSNVWAPNVNDLAGPFGLWGALGKSVAIIGDMADVSRLPADKQAVVASRMKSISGGDMMSVDRKNQQSVQTVLTVRFVAAGNMTPKLPDSGAFAGRWCVLRFTQSFEGREDTTLAQRLCGELPGIFLWAVAGWARLRQQGRFTVTEAGSREVEDMRTANSPVGPFLRDCCRLNEGSRELKDKLYETYRRWCDANGEKEKDILSKEVFSKHLKDGHNVEGRRDQTAEGKKNGRPNYYYGIELLTDFPADDRCPLDDDATSFNFGANAAGTEL